jgi:hypothetical protein
MYNTDMPTRAELPSSAKLVRSTIIAIVTALVLLVTVVLPSEYGIDPTGVGKGLGLKAMGDIKVQLAAEAEADAQADALAAANAAASADAGIDAAGQSQAQPVGSASSAMTEGAFSTAEVVVTLPPGASTEMKMEMQKGDKVVYQWHTNGGKVNHDTHGEPVGGAPNAFHRYLKGVGVESNNGEIVAAFNGSHGWFWRNLSDKEVSITLNVSGQYKNLKQKA